MGHDMWHFGDGFQRKVLVLCLREPGFLQKHVDIVPSKYFENQILGTLCHLVVDYFKKRHEVPAKDVAVSLANDYAKRYGGERAPDLQSKFTKELETIYGLDLQGLEYVAERVRNWGQRQALKGVVARTLKELENPETESMDHLRDVLDSALRVGTEKDLGDDLAEVALQLPELLKSDPVYGIEHKVPTGFPTLDKLLYGGPGAGEICVVAGPPGRGKSTVLESVGKHAAVHFNQRGVDKKVVHISLELKQKKVEIMYCAHLTGLPKEQVIEGSPDYMEKMRVMLPYIKGGVQVKYFVPNSITVNDIRWYLSNLQMIEGINPGLLIVDYADCLSLGRRDDDRYRGMSNIYKDLIAIGDHFGCPVWTGSQVNRAWSDEEVITGRGLADSYLKKADCDLLLTLCRTKDEIQANRARLYLDKVRDGPDTGTIYCHFRGDLAAIWEMTGDEVAALREDADDE